MRAPPAAMVDLHAHVLPAIDDGPPDDASALALLCAAAADGVATVAATPHLRGDHPRVRPPELADRTAALAATARAAGLEIALVTGAEADLGWALAADDAALRLASYGRRGSDLLLETPYGALPGPFEDLLFQLVARGYRVLLAHPERSAELRARPERVRALVRRGVLVQVTAAALAGPRRSRSRRFALALVSEGMAHVIATDAHGEHVARRARLSDGVRAAAALAPMRSAWMVTDAPAAVMAGEPLPPPPPERPRGPLRRALRRA